MHFTTTAELIAFLETLAATERKKNGRASNSIIWFCDELKAILKSSHNDLVCERLWTYWESPAVFAILKYFGIGSSLKVFRGMYIAKTTVKRKINARLRANSEAAQIAGGK